jgi:VWFA-related protein
MARRFHVLLRACFAGVVISGILGVARPLAQGAGQGQPPQGQQPSASAPGQPAQNPPPQPDAEPQTPVFRSGINFVRVDVIVTDKAGRQVSDLKSEDFEVTEDGKPQKVETFKLIEITTGPTPGAQPPSEIRTDYDEEREAARDDVRLFAMFLDDYHVRRESSLSMREQIARFIETQLGPSDMIGVMYPLQPTATVRMTRNHAAIQRAIQQFEGRKYDYTPRNAMEEKYAYYPAEVVERIRNQVSMSAIEALVYRMGSLKEGRKALLLVSEGFTNMLPPQLRAPVAAMPGIGAVDRDNPNAGNSAIEDRAAWTSSLDLNQDLREIYTAANRNNVAIYTIDPRGLATNEFGIDQNINMRTDRNYLTSTMDTLRVLAEETDGRAIVNRNDVTIAMKQIVQDTSAYYLLGYNSAAAPTDGKFHEIKVRVKRPGLQVRSRKGYWALTAVEAERATAAPKPGPPKAVETALATIAAPPRSRLIRTWIGTERGDNGRTRVSFVWEPVGRATATARGGEQPSRVMLMAIGADGAPLFRGRVPESPPAAGLAAGPARATFEVPAGTVQLRLSVEGAQAEVIDSEQREIKVPDMTAPLVLGSPEVFRARTVRDLQTVRADARAVPTPARDFARTERLLVRVNAYGPGATPPTVTARLLNRNGDAMNDLTVEGASGAPFAFELPLAGLALGEYVIEITAAGPDGDVKEHVGFRVTG